MAIATPIVNPGSTAANSQRLSVLVVSTLAFTVCFMLMLCG